MGLRAMIPPTPTHAWFISTHYLTFARSLSLTYSIRRTVKKRCEPVWEMLSSGGCFLFAYMVGWSFSCFLLTINPDLTGALLPLYPRLHLLFDFFNYYYGIQQ